MIDGYLTKEPTKIAHSGAISLKNFKLAMFSTEPINFQLWGADDENAYFQALTKEKLCIVTVLEVEELQEHVLVMYMTLYDKRSGGACWYDNRFGILQPMNFLQLPLLWKESTSELTAKTKGSDKIFTIKLGLYQSLMLQEATLNLM